MENKMKAFKKWWDEIKEYCHNLNGQFDKKDGEWTWRAALEEVLKQVDQSNSDGSIIDWIKKELSPNQTNNSTA